MEDYPDGLSLGDFENICKEKKVTAKAIPELKAELINRGFKIEEPVEDEDIDESEDDDIDISDEEAESELDKIEEVDETEIDAEFEEEKGLLGVEEDEEIDDENSDDFNSNYMTSEHVSGENAIMSYLKEIGKYRLLTREEEQKLFTTYHHGTPEEKLEARNTIINHNLKLVVSIAKKFKSSMGLADLIQEGNLGLMKAVDKYDMNKKSPQTGLPYKFSTYATFWIRQAIGRAISDKSRIIRMPVHQENALNKIKKARNELMQDDIHQPDDQEIADYLGEGWTAEKVRETENMYSEVISLETPVGDDGRSVVGDFVEDKTENTKSTVDKQLAREELINTIYDLFPGEKRRIAEVVMMRYGLDDGQPKTLEECGKRINVTRERVRQLEQLGIKELQKYFRKTRRTMEDFSQDD